MRVAYVTVREGCSIQNLGRRPRADAEEDWDFMMSELPREGNKLMRLDLYRVGDTLRRAEFTGPGGPIEVQLIDDGAW